MHDANLDKFAEVSKARVGRNLPCHVEIKADDSTAVATSLASNLLKES